MNLIPPKVLFFLLSISLLFSCKEAKIRKATNQKKPNIVLINIDDLGWKDLGFMGSTYYETPNIDALAKQGMVFTNAYAGAANCAPSRACLISGLNTPKHGVFTVSPSDRGNTKTRKLIPIKNTQHLSNEVYTLPEMLKSAGYVTASFGKWHVGDNPLEQGIDVNIGGSSKGNPGKGGYFSPYKIDFIKDGPKGEYLTHRLTEEAISFVEKNKDTTFFVYLPYYAVHTPLMGKEYLVEKFQNKKGINGQNNAKYAAMVASMDESIGKVMLALKENGLEKNTLVLFTSDNGGIHVISDQTPLRAGKGSYYEGGIRVPLIVKWPGYIEANTRSNQKVSNLDFFPTLQAIAVPKKKAVVLDGLNLSPILKGASIKNRDLFFHFPIYLQAYKKGKDESKDALFRTRPGSVIISGDWKLHHYYEDNEIELYNLIADEGEQQNLITQNPEKAKELFAKLQTWRIENKAPEPIEKNKNYSSEFEKQQFDKFQ